MKWYQFHLSTVCAMTVVAGILLGMNLMPAHDTRATHAAEIVDTCSLPVR